ncbi:MAG: hypothetical protein ABIP48_18480 [Planctomycetota bacterium]
MPTLLVVSCVYLVVPYLIFLLGWLRWWLAVPMAALLVVASHCAVRKVPWFDRSADADCDGAGFDWRGLVSLVGVALLLSFLSGAGGYGAQDSDHPKHNAVFKCLIEEPWPPTVSSPQGRFPLVYYTAWYLPASLVGKVVGWEGANHFLQFWTALGLVLSLLWFCLASRRVKWIVLGVFVCFSGLDIVGATAVRLLEFVGRPGFDWAAFDWRSIDWSSLRWWNWQIRWWDMAGLRNYSSNMALLFFVPHQALSGWILTGIVMHLVGRESDGARKTLLFFVALSCLWAPFVTLGFAPLVIFDLWAGRRSLVQTVRAYLSLPNFAGLVIFGLMALYFLARFSELPFEDAPGARFAFWAPPGASALGFLAGLLVFFCLEVGILAWAVARIDPFDDGRSKGLFVAALAFLFLLPFFRYGGVNDLVMRASIPSLFVLAVFVARAILRQGADRGKKWVLIVVLALGAANPFAEVYRHVRATHHNGRLVTIPEQEGVDPLWTLNCLLREHAMRDDSPLFRAFRSDTFFRQYIGTSDSLFFKHLARPPIAAVLPASDNDQAGSAETPANAVP